MPGKLIQTTVDAYVCTQLDALAKCGGHKRASYMRHLIEMHVKALSPKLLKITKSTNSLDSMTDAMSRTPSSPAKSRGRRT